MHPCVLNGAMIQAEEITRDDFKGAKWVMLSGYDFYGGEILEKAVQYSRQEGVKISLDLARIFRPRVMEMLELGHVDLVFANEDEARERILPLKGV